MTKYYYTCPIEAAYMAKEFSVKFVNPQPVKDNPIIESNTYSNLSILVGDLEYIIKRFGESFSDLHEYIEKIAERPVFTYEMGKTDFMIKLQEKLKPQILEIIYKKND